MERDAAATSRTERGPELAQGDLERLAGLLELAADRGAFKLEEFEDVGALWRRLSAFVRASGGSGGGGGKP